MGNGEMLAQPSLIIGSRVPFKVSRNTHGWVNIHVNRKTLRIPGRQLAQAQTSNLLVRKTLRGVFNLRLCL